MIEERYIWCRNCNEVHHVTPFDKAPAYLVDQGEERELPVDDWRAFMQRHAGHRLEGLKGVGEKYCLSGKPMDPMSTGYIEVTNGREWFVIRSFRKGIDRPLNFELIPGRLRTDRMAVRIQEEEIRKEMKYHFSWAPSGKPDDGKIEIFLQLFKELVQDLDPQEIEVCGYDYNDSSVAYGLVDLRIVEALVARCLPHFNQEELRGIRRFIDTHRQCDDVMALRITQGVRVEET